MQCKCGKPGGEITLVKDEKPVAVGWLCGPCFGAALAEMEVKRAQFGELLAAGVSRAEANRIMIARIDGEALS